MSNGALVALLDERIAEAARVRAACLRNSAFVPKHLEEENGKALCEEAHQRVKAATQNRSAEIVYGTLCTLTWLTIVVNVLMWIGAGGDYRVVLLTAGTIVLSILAGHAAERRRRRLCQQPHVLAIALRQIETNTPVEAAYAGAAAEVLARWDRQISPTEGRRLLGELKTLLTRGRDLAARHEDVQRAMGGASVEALTAECDDLERRLAETDDPIASATWQHARALCRERCDRARDMDPVRERLSAEQETVRQTLMTTQASLARIGLAAALGASAINTAAGEISTVADELLAQTRAVETAASEVAAWNVLA